MLCGIKCQAILEMVLEIRKDPLDELLPLRENPSRSFLIDRGPAEIYEFGMLNYLKKEAT